MCLCWISNTIAQTLVSIFVCVVFFLQHFKNVHYSFSSCARFHQIISINFRVVIWNLHLHAQMNSINYSMDNCVGPIAQALNSFTLIHFIFVMYYTNSIRTKISEYFKLFFRWLKIHAHHMDILRRNFFWQWCILTRMCWKRMFSHVYSSRYNFQCNCENRKKLKWYFPCCFSSQTKFTL